MVQFGRTIQEALDGKFAEVRDTFVSYQKLKEIIKRIETLKGKTAGEEADDYPTDASDELAELLEGENEAEVSDRFFQILDADIVRLTKATDEFMRNGLDWKTQLSAQEDPAEQKLILTNAFNQLQILFEYCQLNCEGVRKIAKKFDKRCVEKASDKTNQATYVKKVESCNFGQKELIDEMYLAIIEEYATRFISGKQPHLAVQELESARDAMLADRSAMERLMSWAFESMSPVVAKFTLNEKTAEAGEADYLLYTYNTVYICTLIYFFCVGLGLMSNSFKVMTGKELDQITALADNPFVGLMVGIFATVMVQSSSTSTSIAVAMVGSGVLRLDAAIPMIMGANIGTSVTSTIVSLAHADNKTQMNRAFAAATVHDMFNLMAVAILFPLEMITQVLRRFVGAISAPLGGGGRGGKYTGPLKYITKPVLKLVVEVDKKKLKDVAQGKATSGSLMKSGMFAGGSMTDGIAGFLIFVIAIVLICVCLILLVKFLRYLVGAAAKSSIRAAFGQGALVNIFLGVVITVSVQSSSITTSTLVPLAASGLILLEQMFPIVLGANIGTTCTALLAAMAVDKVEGLELALVHLCFNLTGILMIYPYEPIRQYPLNAARWLGDEVALRTWIAPAYLFIVFVFVPGMCLAFYAVGVVFLAIGSMFLFGSIAMVIGARYLYLNPEITMMGFDAKWVSKMVGTDEGIEVEGGIEMAAADDAYIPDIESPSKNYRPAKYRQAMGGDGQTDGFEMKTDEMI